MTAARAFTFLAVILVLFVHCAAHEPTSPAWRAPDNHQPPPPPGWTISHSKLCECTSCSTPECCRGEAEESTSQTCKDSYDFSAPGCAMSVASCSGRCSKFVWRVPLSATCDQRPEACCG